MAYCPNISDKEVVKEFNSIVEHFGGKPLTMEEFKNPELRDTRQGIDRTSMESAYFLWNKYAGNIEAIQKDGNYASIVNYTFKSVSILLSDKAKQIFNKGNKNDWTLDKILTELAIPKEQKQLLLDLGIKDREKLAIELASKYGYTVEINTAKSSGFTTSNTQGRTYEETEEEVINKIQNQLDKEGILEPGSNEYFNEVTKRLENSKKPTSYYSNLTVPGGINYTENEISTPLITPSIKGHAQFATEKGIGWFRSDEQTANKPLTKEEIEDGGGIFGEDNDSIKYAEKNRSDLISTKTRRILELQSDLFQKSRDKSVLTNDVIDENMEVDDEKNQFLQLLNKDNNWVTFFIKSIIQDSAKKGYEKVLFPKGETAAKIEGHTTLENEILSKNRQIKELTDEININSIDDIKDKSFLFLDNKGETIEIKHLSSGKWEMQYMSGDKAFNVVEPTSEQIIRGYKRKNNEKLAQLEQQISDLKSQGIEKLKPIEAFYEIKVGNILEKIYGKENVKTITDEYGNQWREITIESERDLSDISFFPGKSSTSSLLEERSSKYLIKELGAVEQESLTNYLTFLINDEIVNNPKLDLNNIRNKVLTQYKNKFVDLQKYTQENLGIDEDVEQEDVDWYNGVVNNYSTIARIVNLKLQKLNNLIGEVNDDIDIEYEELQGNEKLFNSKSSYEETFKLNAKIKRLFFGIRLPYNNILNEPEILDNNTVEQVVKSIVSGLEPDFDIMMSALRNNVEGHPWLIQLINKLENSPKDIQNLFVSEMNMHYIEHYMVLWRKDKSGFYLSLTLANEGVVQENILKDWQGNLAMSDNVNDEGILTNKQDLMDRYTELVKTPNPELARKWLEDVGISLDDRLWKSIVDGKYTLTKSPVSFEEFIKAGPLKYINGRIKNSGTKSIEEYSILDDSSVQKLAKAQSRYIGKYTSNSHRAGNKTVYSYGKNKYLIDFVRELRNTDMAKEIVEANGNVFNENSKILLAFKNKDEVFTKNFRIATASLQAIKKLGAQNKDNMELHNLNEDEYELHDIGGIHSPNTDVTGNNKRVIMVNFLTTSDKSTPMLVRMLAEDIKLTQDGNLAQESLDKIYDQLVLPEIRRIKLWENTYKNNGSFPNKQIATGGHMFWLLPSLNNLPGMWNTDGTININVESEDYRKIINDEIKRIVTKKVEDKLALWKKYNFYSEKDGKVTLEMLDKRAIEKTVLDPVKSEYIHRGLATDIVFQYLIANANFHTGIVGDPAHFFKSDTYKKTSKQLIKDNVITSEQAKNPMVIWSKLTNEQRIKVSEEVFDNIGKRLAMYIAPGKSTADYSGEANYLFVNDKSVDSLALDQYKAMLGEDANAYSKLGTLEEGTNAQEFTTFLEDIHIRFTSGLISEELYNEINRIVRRELTKSTPNHYYFNNLKNELEGDLLEEYNKLIQQVQKPVYGWAEYNSGMGLAPIYIKTSAYPLTPDLTAGLEIDKMRIMMEKNGIDRLAFPSGTKLGMPINPVTLWNEDGTIRDNVTSEEIKGATKRLSRKGFRLQQDVPYEALKDFINRVSQADKNLFINMLYIDGFEFNGNKYTGAELQQEYQQRYGELYKLGYDALVNELDIKFDANGNITSFNRQKLKEILLEEAVKRDYAINDIEALDLDEALDYIAFMPSASKYEALLNSIVKNRILQMKFRGKSFVLSTEEGYQEDKQIAVEDLKDKSGIIYTDNWKGQLDPGHFEDANGNRLTGEELKKAWKEGTAIVKRPAQVLIPWKFQWKGELLHIEDFINSETGRIDSSKLPQELLEIFGMRIPNQGPNSQSWIEIAGFLPKKSGDILVATRDYLAQMGSDFDVDKLYNYMYNYYFNGKSLEKINFNSKEEIQKLNEETLKGLVFELDEEKYSTLSKQALYLEKINNVWKQALQNKLLDIHIAIHKNTNQLVQKQIVEPLGFWEFKNIATEIASAREIDSTFTAMSDAYQRFKRLNAASGKTLVGDFANNLMFISVAQGKNLYFYDKQSGDRVNFNFGGVWSNGDLSNPLTIRTTNKLVKAIAKQTGEKYKDIENKINEYLPNILKYLEPKDIVFRSTIANGLLSSAVDNEKEQILDKLFMNSQTSRYVKLLSALGYEQEAGYFVKQPIIVDYFNELKRLRSSLGGFNPNAEQTAKDIVLQKYAVTDFSQEYYDKKYSNGKGLSVQSMKDSILGQPNDFNYIQLAAFKQLEYLKKYADDLQALQSAINTDSKGLDKNLFETISKENAVDKIYNRAIRNADSILENTINGFATTYGLRFNNKLWANLFPYKQQGVEYMFDTIEKILGKDEVGVQGKATLKANIWKHFKSYLYTIKELGIYTENIDSERERLFMDRNGNESLASKIKKMKSLPQYANHPFISKLNPEVVKNNKPSIIKMNAGFDQVGELLTVQGAMDLYINDVPIEGLNMTTRELFVDLVRASYLAGGIQEAVQYIKYMPVSYLYSIGFTDKLSKMVSNKFFEDTDKLNIPNNELPHWVLPTFIIQYFQHDTRGLPNLGKEFGKSIEVIKSIPTLGTDVKVVEFSLKNDDYYVTRDNKQVPPEFLTIPSIRDRGLDSNVLFIHRGGRDAKGYPVYQRIPNYGTFAFSEFNYDDMFYPSMIGNYNTGGHVFSEDMVKYPEDKGISEEYSNVTTQVTPNEILALPKSGDVKAIENILSNITLHSNDEMYQVLAQEYGKHIDKLRNTKINSAKYSDEVAGRYSDTGNIYINLKHEQNSTVDGMSETILHEVTHGFVNSVLETPITKLSKDTQMAVADLKRLHSIYKDRIIKRYTQKVYDETIEKFKKKESNLIKDEKMKMEIYATYNIKEFAAMAMSNEDVQRDLNSIDDPNAKERSLLDKFVDIVQKMLKSLGFDIKEGTLLQGAIQDIVVIVKSNNIVETENTIDSKYELFPNVYANKGQIKAINALEEFLNSNKQEFILSGRAGTGKTTILNKVISSTNVSIGGAAVSHKAKKILGKSIGKDKVRTLASMLAIKLDESTGKFTPDEFAREQGKIPIKKYSIIIIDEASMISPAMYKEIMNLKNPKAKVIFVGDKAQLPPIGEDVESPVFNIKDSAELTEITRQAKNSPILNIASKIAENTESKSPLLRVITKEDRVNKFDTSTNSSIVFTNNEEEALDSFVKDFKNGEGNPNFVKIVTFNNEKHNSQQSVKNLNEKVRSKLWGKQISNQFNKGELLTAYDSFTADTGLDRDEILINNSEDYTVRDYTERKNVKGTIKVSSKKDGLRTFTYEYDLVDLELNDSDGKEIYQIFPAIASSSINKFNDDLNKLWKTDKQLAYALKGNFVNLQYGYAITSHKAQGSTYNNVYVFEDNILGATNASSILNKNRSLYVGVSRASNKLVIVSNQNTQNTLEDFEGETVETFFPGKKGILNDEQKRLLNSVGQLTKKGEAKLTPMDKDGSSEKYKSVLSAVGELNSNKMSAYKASIEKTTGETAVVRSGELYYYIKLTPRQENIQDRINSISQEEIFDRMRKCR
jgi:hypothetical protein